MTLGSLAEHEELTALKSSGMRLGRILRPLVVTMVFVAGGALLFANYAWPVANLKFRTLLYSVTRKKPTLNLEDGVFYNGIEGHAIRAAKVDKETGRLEDILIHQHGGDKGRTCDSRHRRHDENLPDRAVPALRPAGWYEPRGATRAWRSPARAYVPPHDHRIRATADAHRPEQLGLRQGRRGPVQARL